MQTVEEIVKPMIHIPSEYSDDEKLHILFKYYRLDSFHIDEQDKPMVILALNREDVLNVRIDEENGLQIEYND
jgi:hypothetical protein